MLQIAVLPLSTKKDNVFSLLEPLVQELRILQDTGISVTGTDGLSIKAKAHLLLATGDTPGAALLCNHEGHQSYNGCRVCTIRTARLPSPNGPGMGHYFPGDIEKDIERDVSHFTQKQGVSYKIN